MDQNHSERKSGQSPQIGRRTFIKRTAGTALAFGMLGATAMANVACETEEVSCEIIGSDNVVLGTSTRTRYFNNFATNREPAQKCDYSVTKNGKLLEGTLYPGGEYYPYMCGDEPGTEIILS